MPDDSNRQPIRLYIDDGNGFVDYTTYLVEGSISIQDQINQPTILKFALGSFDDTFNVPNRSDYVKLVHTRYGVVLATGFVIQEAEKAYQGTAPTVKFLNQQQIYTITVTSDEWILNMKTLPFIPAFVNQTIGQIIQSLADTLLPGFFDYSNIDPGDVIPIFNYDPKQQWSEIVKTFADQARYRYKVINKRIYFRPYGDSQINMVYDDDWSLPVVDRQTFLDPFTGDERILGQINANWLWDYDTGARNQLEPSLIGDKLSTSTAGPVDNMVNFGNGTVYIPVAPQVTVLLDGLPQWAQYTITSFEIDGLFDPFFEFGICCLWTGLISDGSLSCYEFHLIWVGASTFLGQLIRYNNGTPTILVDSFPLADFSAGATFYINCFPKADNNYIQCRINGVVVLNYVDSDPLNMLPADGIPTIKMEIIHLDFATNGAIFIDNFAAGLLGKVRSLFDPYQLQTNIYSMSFANDVLVIGDIEPRTIWEDLFIGDGITSDFNLKHIIFGGSTAMLLADDWSETDFNTQYWTVFDPDDSKFAIGTGALNVLAGSGPFPLGQAYIIGVNGLEIGGNLDLQHGEVEFDGVGTGIIGGIYDNAALDLPSCNAGFGIQIAEDFAFQDEFNRADADTLGTLWTEVKIDNDLDDHFHIRSGTVAGYTAAPGAVFMDTFQGDSETDGVINSNWIVDYDTSVSGRNSPQINHNKLRFHHTGSGVEGLGTVCIPQPPIAALTGVPQYSTITFSDLSQSFVDSIFLFGPAAMFSGLLSTATARGYIMELVSLDESATLGFRLVRLDNNPTPVRTILVDTIETPWGPGDVLRLAVTPGIGQNHIEFRQNNIVILEYIDGSPQRVPVSGSPVIMCSQLRSSGGDYFELSEFDCGTV